MNKCVIVGAGECDIYDLRDNLVIEDNDFIIAADGGFDYLMRAGIKPNLVLGDFDSYSSTYSTKDYTTLTFPTEKDDTDMMLAIKEGLRKGYVKFEIYGALGGRFDHTFANLQCLNYLINNGARGRLIGKSPLFITMIRNESISFDAKSFAPGTKISVFAINAPANNVTEQGLKYTTDSTTLYPDFPLGVSNEFIGEDAYINVEDGTLLICVG